MKRYAERTVVFADVLGFKNVVEDTESDPTLIDGIANAGRYESVILNICRLY